MDATLTAILAALYQKDIALQAALAENEALKAKVAELTPKPAAEGPKK